MSFNRFEPTKNPYRFKDVSDNELDIDEEQETVFYSEESMED